MKNKNKSIIIFILTLLFFIGLNIGINYKIPKMNILSIKRVELKDDSLLEMLNNINEFNFVKDKKSNGSEYYTYTIHLISDKNKDFNNFLGVDKQGENTTVDYSINSSYEGENYKISTFKIKSNYNLNKILVDNKDFREINNEQLNNIKAEKVFKRTKTPITSSSPLELLVAFVILLVIIIPIIFIQTTVLSYNLKMIDDFDFIFSDILFASHQIITIITMFNLLYSLLK